LADRDELEVRVVLGIFLDHLLRGHGGIDVLERHAVVLEDPLGPDNGGAHRSSSNRLTTGAAAAGSASGVASFSSSSSGASAAGAAALAGGFAGLPLALPAARSAAVLAPARMSPTRSS